MKSAAATVAIAHPNNFTAVRTVAPAGEGAHTPKTLHQRGRPIPTAAPGKHEKIFTKITSSPPYTQVANINSLIIQRHLTNKPD
jgi:hypothetical protein